MHAHTHYIYIYIQTLSQTDTIAVTDTHSDRCVHTTRQMDYLHCVYTQTQTHSNMYTERERQTENNLLWEELCCCLFYQEKQSHRQWNWMCVFDVCILLSYTFCLFVYFFLLRIELKRIKSGYELLVINWTPSIHLVSVSVTVFCACFKVQLEVASLAKC